MIGLLLAALAACPPPATPDEPLAVVRARAAVASAPERPGLKLALGRALLDAGRADAAEACAHTVLADWPNSSRARLLLARAAYTRGDQATAEAQLAEVETHGAALAKLEARALRLGVAAAQKPRFVGRAALGTAYDTRATPPRVNAEGEPLPDVADPAAARAALAVEAGLAGHDALARIGVDRTVHFAADDPGALDRTSLWLDGRHEWGLADRIGLGAELRGTLAERVGEPHHLGAGLSVWWRRPAGALTPFVRLRGYGFLYGDAAARPPDEGFEVWTELAAGLGGPLGPLRWDARLSGQWVAPGTLGFTGGGAGVQFALPLGRVTVSAQGGAAARFNDLTDVALPRAGLGLGLRLGGGLSAQVDLLWQRAIPFDAGATVDRWLGGLSLAWTW